MMDCSPFNGTAFNIRTERKCLLSPILKAQCFVRCCIMLTVLGDESYTETAPIFAPAAPRNRPCRTTLATRRSYTFVRFVT